jgi:Bacteriophage lambda head decoration protein D
MTTLTQGVHAAEHLLYEANGDRSREKCTVASGQNIAAGRVTAGPLTATIVAAVADVATGIMYGPVDATSAAQPGVVNVRDCTVNGDIITFAAGITAPQKAAQVASLAALGVIIRS